MQLAVYTDAAAHGRALGLSAVLVADGQEIGYRTCRAWADRYNAPSMAELVAIILGLTLVQQPDRHLVELTVCTDSLSAVSTLVRNEPLHAHFDVVTRARRLASHYAAVRWQWVRGHSGERFNHRAHRLACEEMWAIRDLRQEQWLRGSYHAGKAALGKVLRRWE